MSRPRSTTTVWNSCRSGRRLHLATIELDVFRLVIASREVPVHVLDDRIVIMAGRDAGFDKRGLGLKGPRRPRRLRAGLAGAFRGMSAVIPRLCFGLLSGLPTRASRRFLELGLPGLALLGALGLDVRRVLDDAARSDRPC